MPIRPSRFAIGLTALAASMALAGEKGEARPRAAVADLLKRAQEQSREVDGPSRQIDALRRAAEEVSKERPENVLVEEAFRSARNSNDTDPSKLLERWRTAVEEAIGILEFEVIEESPLPDGFPKPRPIGEIGIQKYPAYRVAKTDTSGGGDDGAFMVLFGHIASRGISMTAPVEMDYADGNGAGSRKVSMGFLYRNTQQGKLGGEKVKVQDIGEHTMVTLGLRGQATEGRVGEAKAWINAWLTAKGKDYRVTGPVRTMIYNSPFTPEKKQFFEVQIPIKSNEPSR
ncbi:heme-binding protein [Singulisphaera rosea]